MNLNLDELAKNFRNTTNGKELLSALLSSCFSANDPLAEAIARFTLFSHPKSVDQLRDQNGVVSNIFPMIRGDKTSKGKIITIGNSKAMYDDNECAVDVFCWCNGISRARNGLDSQFNHIWGKPINRKNLKHPWDDTFELQLYTNPANLCLTPTFLAKLTDTHQGIKELIRYRAQELYSDFGQPIKTLAKPASYDTLNWADSLPLVDNLKSKILNSLISRKSSETYQATSQIGWAFSNFTPLIKI